MTADDPVPPPEPQADPLPASLVRAVDLLRCPVCGAEGLTASARRSRVGGLTCPEGHHWDAARQGVVNLLTGAGTRFTPDTAAMVEARDRFLGAGHYAPIAQAVADAATRGRTSAGMQPQAPAQAPTPTPTETSARHLAQQQPEDPRNAPVAVLDAGAGTGYYLAAVLDALAAEHAGGDAALAAVPPGADSRTAAGTGPEVGAAGITAIGTDLSPVALRRLARAAPAALPLVWDTWRPLPVRDAAVDVVLAVFAPRNLPEFARVLTPDGVLVLVTPRPGHLAELRALTGMLAVEPDKEDRLHHALAGHFTPADERDVDVPMDLTTADAADAAFMGPAGHHARAEELAGRLADVMTPIRVTARVTVHTLRPQTHPTD